MTTKVMGVGPIPARIMLVGEAPGSTEEMLGQPFVGASGDELNRMLNEVGLSRSECYITNVCKYRPPGNDMDLWIPRTKSGIQPSYVTCLGKKVHHLVAEGVDELYKEISVVKPHIIIAFGNTALWALTSVEGIMSWRGSQLRFNNGPPVVPTYHPAHILRNWEWRAIAIRDLRRARGILEGKHQRRTKQYVLRPSFEQAIEKLQWLADGPARHIAVDIETRSHQIACIGFAWSRDEAICIPLRCLEGDGCYWSLDQEFQIVQLLRRILHTQLVVGQNFLYDAQYITRYWGFKPYITWDTLIVNHLLYPALPKALHFLASMYADHYIYWKDDGKEWDPEVGEDKLWHYNCDDATYTFEIFEAQSRLVADASLSEQCLTQIHLTNAALTTMIRGLRIDHDAKEQLGPLLEDQATAVRQRITYLLGHDVNPKSPQQLQKLFYADFGIKPILHRKTKQPTTDDEALMKIGESTPILRPVCNLIADYRQLTVFKSTFVDAEVDYDSRMRCSFNPAGTDTFRFSSSTNAFGSGLNLQNIPTEGSKAANKAKLRKSEIQLPNLRKLFLPDPGQLIWNADLDRADLQVVVWESGDDGLKVALRDGLDLHLFNARDLFGLPFSVDDLRDPGLLEKIKARFKAQREFCKTFIHGTNYGGSARTMAINSRCTITESEQFQHRWFSAHPGIRDWHRRVEHQLHTDRCVRNKLGYRFNFFDRVEGLLPEALAWIPQSTVACVINQGWIRINNVPDVSVLVQVHDSLVGQLPTSRLELLDRINELMQVTIPYDDPLVIPVSIKTSTVSWGDC